MLHHYSDITDKLGEPEWWDEQGVPRYCEFSPDEGANIYSDEILLLVIECQDCGREYKVAMSGPGDGRGDGLADRVRAGTLHYGDPPNYGCDGAGASMNSIPRRVVEFWERSWPEPVRVPELEIPIECDWAPSSSGETER